VASEWGSSGLSSGSGGAKSNTNNTNSANNTTSTTNTSTTNTLNTVIITEKQQVTQLTSEEESIWVNAVGFHLLTNNWATNTSIHTRFYEMTQVYGENHVLFTLNPITMKTQYHEVLKSSGMFQLIDGGKFRPNSNKKGGWRTSESVVSDTGSNKYLFRDPQIEDLFSKMRANGVEASWLNAAVAGVNLNGGTIVDERGDKISYIKTVIEK
jgi:hypothetical protein